MGKLQNTARQFSLADMALYMLNKTDVELYMLLKRLMAIQLTRRFLFIRQKFMDLPAN